MNQHGTTPPPPKGVLRIHELQRQHARRAVAKSLVRGFVGAALLLVAYYRVPLDATSDLAIAVRTFVAAIIITVVIVHELRAVGRAELPQLRAIEALAVTVTLMVVTFAAAYISMSKRDPVAFTEHIGRTDSLYFTLSTLATVGFGDITARTEAARVAVMVQMIFNVAVLGVTVRLIVYTVRHRIMHRDPLPGAGPGTATGEQ